MAVRPTNLLNLNALVIDHSTNTAKMAIVCHKCGTQQLGSSAPNFPPARICKPFIEAGWKVIRNGVKATCPVCLGKQPLTESPTDEEIQAMLEKQQKMEGARQARLAPPSMLSKALPEAPIASPYPKLVPVPSPQTKPTVSVKPTPAPVIVAPSPPSVPEREESVLQQSPNAMKAQARMHQLLAQNFTTTQGGDSEKPQGVYDAGWSDERIAKETGLAIKEVIRWRESAYGSIVDPRTANLERAIAQAKQQMEADRRALQEMVDQHNKTANARIEELERRLQEIVKGPRV